ncbi:hypothetical protein DBT_1019 [Dissulfuribacter thermophilus]|uniref:HTH cro/C1-type domain-containing protein n=1 Tax=Dissulfuribacter thermophilus TaxID=1156395 RepID=A0A1B9F6T0_9BACT|nr:helix-turn-helix transcriptional regulator [Dissulfuribacter thermophilus]OCC15668.1 hypothetical protein DBT_1019 [Dissulfuribacter thermophilus]
MNKKEFVKARKILGKTQKQMAELLGTSLKTVSSYEQGWRSIPPYIERQIYFLLSRRAGICEIMRPCWELKKCPDEIKNICPAWEFNAGKLCWFINGTFCKSCSKKSWEEKIKLCKQCSVFTPIVKMIEYKQTT